MKAFALYTLARAGLFLGIFGVIWLIAFSWLHWDSASVFFTALLAMVLSSIASWFWLRPLRVRLARHVQAQADRTKAALDARRSAEDAD